MGLVRPRNQAAAAPRRGGGARATRCGAVTEVQSRSTTRALRQNLTTDAAVVGARRASDGAGREASSYGSGARHVNVFLFWQSATLLLSPSSAAIETMSDIPSD